MDVNEKIIKMFDVAVNEEFTDLLSAISSVIVSACEKDEIEFVALWNVPCRKPLFLRVKPNEKPDSTVFDPEGKSYFVKWDLCQESGYLYFDGDDKFILLEYVINAIETAIKMNVETASKKVEWGVEAAARILGITYHDVRNAFGTVTGVMQLLEMDEAGNQKVQSRLSNINEILANFDDPNKTTMLILRNNPIIYKSDSVDIASVYDAILKKSKRVYAYSQIELDYDIENGLNTTGDEQKIMQILSELLFNASDAFENSEQGGKISVKVFKEFSNCVISVEDTGFGIDYDSQRYLTTKFFTRKFMRPGLGLTRVRRFVEDWGGYLQFVSEPGKGTSISAAFPINI
jgi:signal transduction histidine kinase